MGDGVRGHAAGGARPPGMSGKRRAPGGAGPEEAGVRGDAEERAPKRRATWGALARGCVSEQRRVGVVPPALPVSLLQPTVRSVEQAEAFAAARRMLDQPCRVVGSVRGVSLSAASGALLLLRSYEAACDSDDASAIAADLVFERLVVGCCIDDQRTLRSSARAAVRRAEVLCGGDGRGGVRGVVPPASPVGLLPLVVRSVEQAEALAAVQQMLDEPCRVVGAVGGVSLTAASGALSLLCSFEAACDLGVLDAEASAASGRRLADEPRRVVGAVGGVSLTAASGALSLLCSFEAACDLGVVDAEASAAFGRRLADCCARDQDDLRGITRGAVRRATAVCKDIGLCAARGAGRCVADALVMALCGCVPRWMLAAGGQPVPAVAAAGALVVVGSLRSAPDDAVPLVAARGRRGIAERARLRRLRNRRARAEAAGGGASGDDGANELGWLAPVDGNVTLFTFNVARRFGARDWAPFNAALPSRKHGAIGGLTETNGELSGGMGDDHHGYGSRRQGRRFGGANLVVSNMFASRRLDTARLARADGVPDYGDLVAAAVSVGSRTVLGMSIYVPAVATADPVGSAAIWDAAMAHADRVVTAVRGGKYGSAVAAADIAIFGDFNAHVGSGAGAAFKGWVSADTKPCDARGRSLALHCARWEVAPVNGLMGVAQPTYVRHDDGRAPTNSVLDLILVSKGLRDGIDVVRVLGEQPELHSMDAIINSGEGCHRWVEARVLLPVPPPTPPRVKRVEPRPPCSWMRVTGKQRDDFGTDINRRAAALIGDVARRRDEMAGAMLEGIAGIEHGAMEAATDEAARAAFDAAGVELVKARCMTRALRRLVLDVKVRMREARAHGDDAARQAAFASWRTARREVRREVRRKDNLDSKRLRAQLLRLRTTSPKLAWQILKRIIGKLHVSTPFPPQERADGTWARTSAEIKVELTAEFQRAGRAKAWDDETFDVDAAARTRAEYERIVTLCSEFESFGSLDADITADELIHALNETPRHKARDVTGWHAEHIIGVLRGTPGVERRDLPAVTAWVEAFNHIFRTGVVPQEWKRQVVIALHKGHDKPVSFSRNYRGVTVTHHLEAVMHRIVLNRIVAFAESRELLGDSQYGFRKARNCEQAVATLVFALEAAVLSGRTAATRRTFCAFLDVKSAFDSVSREGLTVKLFAAGVRGRTLAYLRRSPLVDAVRTVLCGDEPMDEGTWSDTQGVSQGVVGSPFAFALCAADLSAALKIYEAGCGVELRDGSRVFSISYADDIVLCAATPRGLQKMLDAAFANSRTNRYEFSAEKSEVVVFGAEGDEESLSWPWFFHLGGVALQRSTSFKYLGAVLNRAVAVRAERDLPAGRRAALEDKIRGTGKREVLLRVASANPTLTVLDSRQIYFCHVLGVADHCSSIMARGASDFVASVQRDCSRIMLGLPAAERDIEYAGLEGDLGLRSTESVFASSALRLFSRIHSVPKHSQLWRSYDNYRGVCDEELNPAGNWCEWVRRCLAGVGHPEYFDGGWPPSLPPPAPRIPTLKEEIAAWQQRVWREGIIVNGVPVRRRLCPLYARLKSRYEFCEYMREGGHPYRRAMWRWRTEALPAQVTFGRWAGVPRHLRFCTHCALQECEDTEHLLLRCNVYAAETALMIAAVRECMPPEVVAWAGNPGDHPDRWVSLLLDGELAGVPFAEAYGRDRRAVRAFTNFRWNKAGYLEVLRVREALRARLRAPLTSIMSHRARRSGYFGA